MSASYSDGGAYSLDKITLPDVHLVHGREFPVAYRLNTHDEPYDEAKVESLLETLSKKGVFTKLLEDHGALVLRDSVLDSDDSKIGQLASVIKTVEQNRGLKEFQQNGTLGLRDLKGYNLYRASTAPAENKLRQHNEYSRFKKYPVSIVFTIADYKAKGGETPLVHNAELYDSAVEEIPEFVERLRAKGLKYSKETWSKEPSGKRNLTWKHEVTYGRHIQPEDDLATQKRKAEEIAKTFISDDVKWSDNDDLVINSLTFPIKLFKGEPHLFSSLDAFAENYKPGDKDNKVKYGDDELFDIKHLEKFHELTEKHIYAHSWESGDIVFVHNYQVSHGKFPYEGKRETLVGMWDSPEHNSKFVNQETPVLVTQLNELKIA